MIKDYYSLTKPGIIRGNALTLVAGFLLASKGNIDLGLLLTTLGGLSLVIASACVFNNYIDRGIDAKMARTKKRASVTGTVSLRNAMIYATMLGLVGFYVLAQFTNSLTVFVGLTGFIFYVVLYGIAKRRSIVSTIVGSIAGAVPPVAGYTAVANQLDTAAWLLFLILVFWQMPHFYAIAMYRHDDYKKAGLPVLPVVMGNYTAKIQILFYIVAFIVACSLLTIFDYAGYIYLIVMFVVGLTWFYAGVKGFKTTDDKKWARKMFGASLVIISVWSAMVSLNSLLV